MERGGGGMVGAKWKWSGVEARLSVDRVVDTVEEVRR